MSSRCEDGMVTGDFFDEQPKFNVTIFSELVEYPGRFVEVVLCGNFISIYKINRTLHGRLEIRNFSSNAESVSHE